MKRIILLATAGLIFGCSDDNNVTANNAATNNTTANNTTANNTTANNTTGGTADVLVSEIATQPDAAEFIELWNSGDGPVDLSDYYITDNAGYTSIAAGLPWEPVGTPGTDFLARFPNGLSIEAGAVVTIALSDQFETQYGTCPDVVLADSDLPCGAGTVPAMRVPTNGGIGQDVGLTNNQEMVMLFTWDGDTSNVARDSDYVFWGDSVDEPNRVDKSMVTGYLPDTPRASQLAAPAAGDGESIERCSLETDETSTGGNGITGHDETSENLAVSFVIQGAPSPGALNDCLP